MIVDGNLDDYTTEELVTEVKDYYQLLEENTVSVTYGEEMRRVVDIR